MIADKFKIIIKITILLNIIMISMNTYSMNKYISFIGLTLESSHIYTSAYIPTNQQILQKYINYDESDYVKNQFIFFYSYYDTIKYAETNNIKNEIVYIGKQFISSELWGLGLSLIGGVIGGRMIHNEDAYGSLGSALIGMYCGYMIGTSIGTYRSGNNSQYYGRYLPTVIGAIIGAYAGYRLFDAFDQKGFGSISLIICAPIGSIIGFNIFRKSKQ
jgi:uncharacterized membrane protein YeaQ/YmgE (transglycosylase-associated protein family)